MWFILCTWVFGFLALGFWGRWSRISSQSFQILKIQDDRSNMTIDKKLQNFLKYYSGLKLISYWLFSGSLIINLSQSLKILKIQDGGSNNLCLWAKLVSHIGLAIINFQNFQNLIPDSQSSQTKNPLVRNFKPKWIDNFVNFFIRHILD